MHSPLPGEPPDDLVKALFGQPVGQDQESARPVFVRLNGDPQIGARPPCVAVHPAVDR